MAKRISAPRSTREVAEDSIRNDGMVNVLTGLGTGDDKRTAVMFRPERFTQMFLEEIYRGDDVASRCVDVLPEEMFREGFTIQIPGEKDLGEELDSWLEESGAMEDLHQGECWRRAYGGAGIMLGANDGVSDLRLPLNLDNLKSLDWLAVYSPQELPVTRRYNDPQSGKYGQPLLYRLQPINAVGPYKRNGDPYPEVHESRIIRMDGILVSRRQNYENWNYGWGDSILARCLQVVWDFQQAFGNTSVLIQDFAQGVYQMAGLAELVAQNKVGVVQERIKMAQRSRSTLHAMLVDARDNFDRKVTPVSGLADLLDKCSLRLAMSADMPVSRLLGQAPAGLNATGDSDIRWFYDKVRSCQKKKLKPAVKRIMEVLFACKKGPTKGSTPKGWSVGFPPLWQLAPDQEATRRLAVAQADHIYLQDGVVTPAEIGTSRFGGDEYSADTKIDVDLRDKMAEGDEDDMLGPDVPPVVPGTPPGSPAATGTTQVVGPAPLTTTKPPGSAAPPLPQGNPSTKRTDSRKRKAQR